MKRSVDNGELVAIGAPAKRSHHQTSTLLANSGHDPLLLRPTVPRPGADAAWVTEPSSVKAMKTSGSGRTPFASGTAYTPSVFTTAEPVRSVMKTVEKYIQSATSFSSAAAQPQSNEPDVMALAKQLLAATLSVPGARPVRQFAGLCAAMNFIEMERLKRTMGVQPAAAVAALSPCGHSSGGGANEVAGPFGVQVQGCSGSTFSPPAGMSTPTQQPAAFTHAFQAQPSMDGMGMLSPPVSPSACWVAATLPLLPSCHSSNLIAAPAPATFLAPDAPPQPSSQLPSPQLQLSSPMPSSPLPPSPQPPSPPPQPQLQPPPQPTPWTPPPMTPLMVGQEEEQEQMASDGMYDTAEPNGLDQEDSLGLGAWLKANGVSSDDDELLAAHGLEMATEHDIPYWC